MKNFYLSKLTKYRLINRVFIKNISYLNNELKISIILTNRNFKNYFTLLKNINKYINLNKSFFKQSIFNEHALSNKNSYSYFFNQQLKLHVFSIFNRLINTKKPLFKLKYLKKNISLLFINVNGVYADNFIYHNNKLKCVLLIKYKNYRVPKNYIIYSYKCLF